MRVVAVVLLAAGLGVGAAGAAGMPSTAASLTLIVDGHHESVAPSDAFKFGIRHVGTFRAGAPFCASGTFADQMYDGLDGRDDSRIYQCDDGTGTLTVAQEAWFEHKFPFTDSWRIIEGSGRYSGLRGKGTFRGEQLDGSDEDLLTITYRSVLSGYIDYDSVAPTITISEARVTKVRRPSRTYVLRLSLSIRDGKATNTVSYTVAVEPKGGGLYLVERKGSTSEGRVTMTLRFRPPRAASSILLQLRAEDPVGNWRWVTRPLRLSR